MVSNYLKSLAIGFFFAGSIGTAEAKDAVIVQSQKDLHAACIEQKHIRYYNEKDEILLIIKEDTMRLYNLAGITLAEGPHKNGKEHGEWKYYYHNTGSLLTQGLCQYGKQIGKWVEYYSTGELLGSGEYVAGHKHGIWNYYGQDGSLIYSITYENGIKQGTGQYNEKD